MRSALRERLGDALHGALPASAAVELDELRGLLSAPPSAELGDFSLPCFSLARRLRRAPAQIAAEMAAAVEPGLIASAEAKGPYLNLRLDLARAAALVLGPWARGEPPPSPVRGGRVMVEYSQPNTHKAFHVGHLRNVCLGDALVRLLRADGHEVVAANYLGDVGAHIAKCLWWYLDVLAPAQREPPPTGRGEWLGELYTRATLQLDDWAAAAEAGDAGAADRLARARARTAEILQRLEAREPELTAVWRSTRQWSLDEFAQIYSWCGVVFDRLFFESEVDELGLRLVEEFRARGLFVDSEGAIGVVNEEIPYMPFFMLRKQDGTSLYSTKDLALARLKFEEYGVDRSIYVVDSRQSDHFRHVFLTLRKMGFAQADRCEHVPYEMVELPDGPMSTRRGNVVLFRALREQMEAALREQHFAKYAGEWSEEEIAATVHAVALGAIKYGMLQRDVGQKIVFDLAQWLSFEGNTGPYLQYVTARIASILRKAGERGAVVDTAGLVDEPSAATACAGLAQPAERALVLALAGLPDAFNLAVQQLRPSALCTHLFELGRAYNRFQVDCDVIHSEGEVLRARLVLVKATREALAWGLARLGIPAPERM